MNQFHKTDGALLGSCGDIRDPDVEAGAYIVAQQLATNTTNALMQAGNKLGSLLAARRAEAANRNSALVEHAQMEASMAEQRQRQADAKPAARPVFAPSFKMK